MDASSSETAVNLESIPVELIKTIFEELVLTPAQKSRELTQAGHTGNQLRQKESITLSHISRTLRSVALDTPKLWTLIHTRMHPQVVKAFLTRSGAAPLSIFIKLLYFEEATEQAFKRELRAFLKLVSASSHRWELLACDISGWEVAKWFFKRGERMCLPMMKHMFIQVSCSASYYDPQDDDDDMEPWNAYPLNWNLPSLISLNLKDVFPGPRTVSGTSLESIMLNKEDCSAVDFISDMSFAAKLLPSLKSLKLDEHQDCTISLDCLFSDDDPLTFSGLQVLETNVQTLPTEYAFDFKQWRIFALCRFPQLQTLDISFEAHQNFVFEVLPVMPALEMLHVNSTTMAAFLLEGLVNNTVVPSLKSLQVCRSILCSQTTGGIDERAKFWKRILPNGLQSLTFDRCDFTAVEAAALTSFLVGLFFPQKGGDSGARDSVEAWFWHCEGFVKGYMKLWKVEDQLDLQHMCR